MSKATYGPRRMTSSGPARRLASPPPWPQAAAFARVPVQPIPNDGRFGVPERGR